MDPCLLKGRPSEKTLVPPVHAPSAFALFSWRANACTAISCCSPTMLTNAPDWLHEIDHTGDIGIRVRADTLTRLFERAATGTFHVLTDLDAVRPREATSIQVEGRDREALMVRWLSELNYRHTVDDVLYCAFEVESLAETDDGLGLTATVRGEPLDPARHTVHTEIKAITFHGLDVHETDPGWAVQVIFDM